MAGKIKNKIFEEYENENIICFGDLTSGTFPIIGPLQLSHHVTYFS